VNSFTSSSKTPFMHGWRSMLPFLFASITCMIGIVAVEYAFRHAHGVPLDIVPGMTRAEFQWKIANAAWSNSIFVIGDSRAGWGFSEVAFADEAARLGAGRIEPVNAGLAGTRVESIVHYLLNEGKMRSPQTVVINYSPASFFYWPNHRESVKPLRDLKRQDVIDDEISIFLRQWLYTLGRTPEQIFDQFRDWRSGALIRRPVFVSRNRYTGGFYNATRVWTDGAPVNENQEQLSHYARVVLDVLNNGNQARPRMLKAELISTIRRARSRGWHVAMIRLPVGKEMQKLESQLRPEFSFSSMAEELGVPSIDFNELEDTRNVDSLDQSHMTPESTRFLSAVLARFLWENVPETMGK